jgi:predicted amidohydrolase
MRVAVAQLDPKLGENERNLETCFTRLDEAAAAGAELPVVTNRKTHGALVEETVPIET